jgi:hypothetical protein
VATRTLSQGDLAELRCEAAAHGADLGMVPDFRLREIVAYIGDVDLAACALALNPQPLWVRAILHGFPPPPR